MRGRRTIAVLAAVLTLFAVTAEGCPDTAPKPSTTKSAAPAGQPAPPPAKPAKPEPTEGAQPAPVQRDPSAHNTQPGEVGLYVSWESQNKATPVCEYSHNGRTFPCNNMVSKHDDEAADNGEPAWYGFWETVFPAKAGDTISLNAQGADRSVVYVTCEYSWKGHIGSGTPGERRCGLQATLN
jgi:hypothetical protein